MSLKVGVAGILALLTMSVTAAAGDSQKPVEVARVQIAFDVDDASRSFTRGQAGLLYGAESTLTGKIVYFDAVGRPIRGACPIVLRTRSLGVTAIAVMRLNGAVSLNRVDGKTPRELLGNYYGLQLGLAFGANLSGLGAVSGNGVLMRDLAGGLGIGVDLSVPKVTIMADTGAKSDKCEWDRPIKVSSDYTGGDWSVADNRDAPVQVSDAYDTEGLTPNRARTSSSGASSSRLSIRRL